MRLPEIPEQQSVFDLIEYLNERVGPESSVVTIPYVLYDDYGNRTVVNVPTQDKGQLMTYDHENKHPDEIGFPIV